MTTEQASAEQVESAEQVAGSGEVAGSGQADQAAHSANQVQVPGTEQPATPGDALRSLPVEAQQRGTRFVSAQAMQARLFSVYDAAAAAEDALALVQNQLTLTLNRSYYDAEEIETMAQQLDSLLPLDSVDLTDSGLVSEE
jgi:hypothetical protein